MAGPDPAAAAQADTSIPTNRNLVLRVASALVLAPLAIGAAWWGSWPFAVFWTLAALAVWWEWARLVDPQGSPGTAVLGGAALVLAGLLAGSGRFDKALIIVFLALFGVVVTAIRNARWMAGGIAYASALLLAPVAIRTDADHGFAAILFLFAIVWSTDIGGYFGGRLLGGPKLMPAVSPKKTWSGALVGTATALLAAFALARWLFAEPPSQIWALIAVAALLSAISQAGDLFESALKRHFGAKDASGLIPGHGGVMDRLDGFLFAAFGAACLGVARGGLQAAGGGLILW